MIQRAEAPMGHEHQQVVQALEETAQTHNNAVVRQKEEDYEARLQEKQANVSHEQGALTSQGK
eukprot:4875328-Prorocentrum_lima.AAC.1